MSPWHSAVHWNGVKAAVSCAHQHMPWNLLLIIALNNFWCFKLGFAQKNIWNTIEEIVFEKISKFTISQDNLFDNVSNILLSQSQSRWRMVYCKTLIRSRFQGIYWRAHKTTTSTSIQHTVCGGGGHCVFKWILRGHLKPTPI